MKTLLARSFHLLLLNLILGAEISAIGQQFNPPSTLKDELTESEIANDTRNLVICIHGWNPPGILGATLTPPRSNKYTQEDECSRPVVGFKTALNHNTPEPWSLLLYQRETDAATGFERTDNELAASLGNAI